jgi:hypothetical protein
MAEVMQVSLKTEQRRSRKNEHAKMIRTVRDRSSLLSLEGERLQMMTSDQEA